MKRKIMSKGLQVHTPHEIEVQPHHSHRCCRVKSPLLSPSQVELMEVVGSFNRDVAGVIESYELPRFAEPRFVEWIMKSAEQGVGKSQFQLACAYRDGSGVLSRCPGRFQMWLLRSATANYAPAQLIMYQAGICSYEEGQKWLKLAVLSGHKEAMFQYVKQWRNVIIDTESVIDMLARLAEGGHCRAQAHLADKYFTGGRCWKKYFTGSRYWKKSITLALHWSRKSLDGGNESAAYLLGLHMMKSDRSAGMVLLRRAAHVGHKDAIQTLCEQLIHSKNLDEQVEGVALLFAQTRRTKFLLRLMALCHHQGKGGLEKNVEKASDFERLADDQFFIYMSEKRHQFYERRRLSCEHLQWCQFCNAPGNKKFCKSYC